jgi:hypothetical protein
LSSVAGVESIGNPVLTVVVSTSGYLDIISNAGTLASFLTIGLDRRRLSSYIVSWVWSDVFLNIGSIGCVVDDVTSDIGRIVCWSISRRVGLRVGCSIGSGVDRMRYFVFASTFFSYRVKGTLATKSLARTLRSASGVGSCCRSAVSNTSFFNLSGCDADVRLEASDHWGIFEVVQCGKSGSQVGLRRIVKFESIMFEVPYEVSHTQSVGTR